MQNSNSAKTAENLNKVIKIDEAQIRNHLGEIVRSTVEQTLNPCPWRNPRDFCRLFLGFGNT